MTGWLRNGTEEVVAVLTNAVDLELVEVQKGLVERYCECLQLVVYLYLIISLFFFLFASASPSHPLDARVRTIITLAGSLLVCYCCCLP
jgi:hypothetical protein